MKKFRVTQHIDSLVSTIVDAEDEDDAIEKGEKELTLGKYDKQILENAQAGETWAEVA